MKNEMVARSAFTGITVVAHGFEDANQYARKVNFLRELLRRTSGGEEPNLPKLIEVRMEAERLKSADDSMKGRCSLAPIIGDRAWFKRQADGKLFRCMASTFGRAAVCCDSDVEQDVIELNDGAGWKSVVTSQTYVRIPTIRKVATT